MCGGRILTLQTRLHYISLVIEQILINNLEMKLATDLELPVDTISGWVSLDKA